MSTASQTDGERRLCELAHALFDDRMEPSERIELDRMLHSHPWARSLYRELAWLHCDLQLLLTDDDALAHTPSRSRLPPAATRGRFHWLWLVAIAAALLVMLSSTWQSAPTPRPFLVTNHDGIVQSIPGGQSLTTTGSTSFVRLQRGDQAMLLGGEGSMKTSEDGRFTLQSGVLLVSAASFNERSPIRITTPNGRVSGRRGDFDLHVDGDRMRLSVRRGEFQYFDDRSGHDWKVSGGMTLVRTTDKDPIQLHPQDVDRTLWSEDFESTSSVKIKQGSRVIDAASGRHVVRSQYSSERDRFGIEIRRWDGGLFHIQNESALKMQIRMNRYAWTNLFCLTRTDDGADSEFRLYKSTALSEVDMSSQMWFDVVIPLSTMQRKVRGEFMAIPPDDGEILCELYIGAPEPDREILLDSIEVRQTADATVTATPFAFGHEEDE